MMIGSRLRASLICGLIGAIASALVVYMSGAGVFWAFAAYSLGGAFVMLGTATALAQTTVSQDG